MSDSNDGLDHPILKLSPAEKAAYSHLFSLADSDSLGVVTGERAVSFFEKTHVPAPVLGEIWQIADTENRGLLTKPGFCMVLRLIGWWQNGNTQPSAELAFKPAPIPKFDGITLPGPPPQVAAQSPTMGGFPANALQPQLSGQSSGGGPIRVPPLDPTKVQQYSSLFDRSGAQQGMLDGGTAKSIFERAGLPNETLGKIWMLSDREQRGGLDQTEFIVAMHLLTSMKSKAMTALPVTLPQGLWEAAARRGQRPISRQMSGAAAAVPRQFTGNQAQARTQSPLARPSGYGTPPPQQAQPTGTPWLVSQQEKSSFDQFFSRINPSPTGLIGGEQAVGFFSNSGLSEDTLAQIWDLADIDSDGQLSRDEFAVAMYLIKQQRSPNAQPLPAFLPAALVPPSMRGPQQQQQVQQIQQQQQATPIPQKASAADDLFGLDDSPTQPPQPQQAALQPQTTGASATRDPFNSSPAPGSPSSPARFQQQQSTGGAFKQFVPTSAFGASLAQQHTGASSASSQPQTFTPAQSSQTTGLQQQQTRGPGAPMPSTMDDLLGDSEAGTAESSKLTNDTTELANMSNQIGNLRTQMEATHAKKSTTQADLASTNAQKTDLEQRLQQFRAQYETEVRTVKDLEAQLAASRLSTKQLSQELAMLEGTHQDLSNQHQTVSQQLQADQQENANLKQRISQINTEVARMKPEVEKMKLDARQQKGMVSINKKQLATNESERDRLATERADLERGAASSQEETSSRGISPEPSAAVGLMSQASNVTSPSAGSAMSSTNPFFRKPSGEATSDATPPATGPTPSAFDALFGPSSHFAPGGQVGSRTGTPPATSFIGRNLPTVAAAGAGVAGVGAAGAVAAGMTDSTSSADDGEATPAATPPPPQQSSDFSNTDRDAFLETSGAGPAGERGGQLIESPGTNLDTTDIPPPPESRQFTPTNLPLTGGVVGPDDNTDAASSTRVVPPASNVGDAEPPGVLPLSSPTAEPEVEAIPGAFPDDGPQPTTASQEVLPSSGESSAATPAAAGSSNVNDDFDAAFAGFGAGEAAKDGAATEDFPTPAALAGQQPRGFNDEFPPIQSLDEDDSASSDDDEDEAGPSGTRGFDDSFSASEPSQPTATSSSLTAEPDAPKVVTPGEELPDISKQTSPPTYDQSNDPAHGGHGDRTSSNQFPLEWGGLLPSREDPTASPPATSPPAEAEMAAREVSPPNGTETPVRPPPPPQRTSSLQPSAATDSGAQPIATPTTDVFVDASSRPMSSVTDVGFPPASSQAVATERNAFDDFDEFDDLAEAKEADKSSSNDFDFGFGSRQSVDEFNPAFDSPAASNTATPTPATRSVQQSQDISSNGNGFADFAPNVRSDPFASNNIASNGNGSVQQTPQGVQHDWDAIFSGLDSNKDLDTTFGNSSTTNDDPWAPATNGNGIGSSSAAPAASTFLAPTTSTETTYAPPPGPPPSHQAKALGADRGGAITPGTEHDDPILKRLTGMGYQRKDALTALEMFDYDINKAVDHLAGA